MSHPIEIPRDIYLTGNVRNDMLIHVNIVAKYAKIHAEAYKEAKSAEIDMKKTKAVMEEKFRKDLTNAGLKVTDRRVENLAIASPEYQAKVQAYVEASARELFWRHVMDAIKSRVPLLVSLSADDRLGEMLKSKEELASETLKELNRKLTSRVEDFM